MSSNLPIKKHDLPIPLELSLSLLLSSEKEEKAVVKETPVSLSIIYEQEKNEGTSISEILFSLVSNSSKPSVRFNISFDANIVDHDNLLGRVDNEANINLRCKLRNLKEQKNNTIGNGKKGQSILSNDFTSITSYPSKSNE